MLAELKETRPKAEQLRSEADEDVVSYVAEEIERASTDRHQHGDDCVVMVSVAYGASGEQMIKHTIEAAKAVTRIA